MDYALAKQLKDAGFPWSENDSCGHCGYSNGSNAPTLSELIEACGDGLTKIARQINGWEVYGVIWGDGKFITDEPRITVGQTLEEAIAKLWLALNKHD